MATDPVTAIRTDQWNESPQAQEPDAFGLSIVKPCFSIVSTKSMVAPIRYGALILSVTTCDAAELGHDVTVDGTVIEVELVAETGAATRLHGDAQLEIVAAFLGKQITDLVGCTLGEDDALLRGLLLNGHLFLAPASIWIGVI